MQTKPEIKILCGGETFMDISDMHWFQGKLKTITKERFQDLKDSLKENGLPIGFHAWHTGKKVDILDGHHRWLALTELRKEGWIVPKVPVNFVKAKSRKEAAKMVLIMNAQYAKMNENSVSNFMIDFELLHTDLKLLNFADVRMDYFFPNDSVAKLTSPLITEEEVEKSLESREKAATSFSAQDVLPSKEDIKAAEEKPVKDILKEVKEEKMDVVGKRFVIIIDCQSQDMKDALKNKLRETVESNGAKFF